MINRVVLTGRLTKDVEMKYTPNGIAIASFTIAVNRAFSNQNGEKEADFIQIKVWRKTAETCANFLRKGSLVGIDGRIETGSYEGQDGKRVYTTNVVADSVQFLEPRSDNASQGQQAGQQYGNRNQQQQQPYNQQNNYPNY